MTADVTASLVNDLELEIDAMRLRVDAQSAHLVSLKREVMRIRDVLEAAPPAPPAAAVAPAAVSKAALTRRRNDFGREDASHLPAAYLSQCYVDMDVVGLMETVLFDPDHAENGTVRVAASAAALEVWRSGAWHAAADDEDVLADIVRGAYRILSSHSRRNQESVMRLLSYDLDAFEDLKEFYERLYDDDDDRVRTAIRAELADLLTAYAQSKTIDA